MQAQLRNWKSGLCSRFCSWFVLVVAILLWSLGGFGISRGFLGFRAWIRGIFIERPVCLSCHGPPGSLDPEVTTALKNLYPQDEATGYRMGDLRGAFVVEELR